MEATQASHVPSICQESQIRFHPLFFRLSEDEQDVWHVGVEKSALALELPVEGVKAIQALQAGRSLAETATLLQQEYGEAIDLVDLVQELTAVGLVERIDTALFAPPERIGQKWLERIAPATVNWLYARPALVIWTVLILLGPLLLIFQPAVRPRAQDLLWSPSYTLDLVVLLVLSPFMLLKHEAGHLLAARGQGLPAELTLSNRLFYLVAVSRIGETWNIRRFERLVIYCAGMINDAALASLCLLLLGAASYGIFYLPSELSALLRLIALTAYLGISWQLQIFLRTDLYHVFTELTRRHDLPAQTSALLASWGRVIFQRAPRHHARLASYDPITLGYAIVSVVGVSIACLWFLWYGLPATVIAFRREIGLIVASIPTKNMPALLDGLAALGMQGAWFLLLGWSIARKHIKRPRKNM